MKKLADNLNLLVMGIPLILTGVLTVYAFLHYGFDTAVIVFFISLFLLGGLEAFFGFGCFAFKKWAESDRTQSAEFDRRLKSKKRKADKHDYPKPPSSSNE